eukprot:2669163-Prymnesium_polylepis.1
MSRSAVRCFRTPSNTSGAPAWSCGSSSGTQNGPSCSRARTAALALAAPAAGDVGISSRTSSACNCSVAPHSPTAASMTTRSPFSKRSIDRACSAVDRIGAVRRREWKTTPQSWQSGTKGSARTAAAASLAMSRNTCSSGAGAPSGSASSRSSHAAAAWSISSRARYAPEPGGASGSSTSPLQLAHHSPGARCGKAITGR